VTSSRIVCLCSRQNWKLCYLVLALGDQLVVGLRVASAVAAADRTLGDAPTSKQQLIDWQSMSGRTSSCPSFSQQWTCIVIIVTDV